MTLAIISHTEHYTNTQGQIVGWGPTVTEINHLTTVFDEVYHVAMLHQGEAPPSALPYTNPNIKFVALPPLGGQSLSAKMQLLTQAPKVLRTVSKELKQADYFQFRAPTGIGVYVIPYLIWFSKTKGWFKYAGNWNQKHPPLGYRFQRWMLKQQQRPVTINGQWPNQPKHCITFENPCLTDDELLLGEHISKTKTFSNHLNLCYVGRLETPKGVRRIIEALLQLPEDLKQRIGTVHFVGDGPERHTFETLALKSDLNITFHGFLPRDQVFDIYKTSHLFLMPTTASEGFPKVIAEAMNFGCIPIVSQVSSIGQYIIHKKTGVCMSVATAEALLTCLQTIFKLDVSLFATILANQRSVVNRFGFTYYNNRIQNHILKQLES
ncbi:glycosyltransferase [Mangrovimonas spongiae]|uniref:Glycosyltransferase n=1 Tax=Mangrovimonas spongiae TaxID=2494697 RepID=A0A3R9PKP7_9FLAO|nr:glycosyltransferase [Mangrovimonas spongiae]RSK40490.1 glycosyltransferase [Mangrovimonas spongiae]